MGKLSLCHMIEKHLKLGMFTQVYVNDEMESSVCNISGVYLPSCRRATDFTHQHSSTGLAVLLFMWISLESASVGSESTSLKCVAVDLE